MKSFIFIPHGRLRAALFGIIAGAMLLTAWQYWPDTPTAIPVTFGGENIRTIHIVALEHKSHDAQGNEIEIYRWDPGTIFIAKDEKVQLSFYGLHGQSHPFRIEGMDIVGELKKGETTTVTLQPREAGIFKLLCLSHADRHSNGPMEAYIVVR